MDNKRKEIMYNLFIFLFLGLNIANTFIITTQGLNRYIVPFNHSFGSVFNSIIGNLAVFLLFMIIIGLFIKKPKTKLIIMLLMTFILNFGLFGTNIYNRYYGTSFTLKSLSIFQNPSDSFGFTIAYESFKELITYYRIILFIPTVILGIMFIRLRKEDLSTLEVRKKNIKSAFSKTLLVTLLLFTNLLTFNIKASKTDVIDAAKATHATQNIGFYQYLFLDVLGYDYESAYNEDLTEEYIYKTLNEYNKNKADGYTNIFDNKEYRKTLNKGDISNISGKLVDSMADNDPINGILEDYNLVLIHLESFNSFLLDIPEVSSYLPNMKNIMAESYVFNNFYTNVGLGNSFDAEVALMTGLNANGTSTLAWDYNPDKDITNYDFQTLAKLFKEKNYTKTQSIHGNTGVFYNRENFHPEVFGIKDFYGKEEFVRDANYDQKDTDKAIEQFAKDYNHDSGKWVPDRLVMERMNEQIIKNISNDDKFLMYLITMLPHTPYHYDPYNPIPKDTEMYDKEFIKKLDKQTIRYINFMKYYDETFRVLFEKVEDFDKQIVSNKENVYNHKKTAYVFYGDHGSGIAKPDLDTLFNKKLDPLEARRKLLQTTAFIYVPGDELNDLNFRKGLLKGEQNLVRGQTDLYRTIIELFDLPIEDNDYYFGVNGLSKEPTFSIDNRTGDVVTDYFVGSLRNDFNFIELKDLSNIDLDKVRKDIIRFKIASDHAINNNLFKKFKQQ